MYDNKKLALNIVFVLLGIATMVLSITETIRTPYASGFGAGLAVVGISQIIRYFKYKNDPEFRQKTDVAQTDERIRYIGMKAWAWTGYISLIVGGVLVIILGIMNNEAAVFASYAVCFELLVYIICYLIISKKE